MVKKLFKHEFIAFIRMWVPVQLILFTVAIFGRVIRLFESDTRLYSVVEGSSTFLYVITAIAAVLFTIGFGVIRFYKNLFTQEGYLSFTLPVTSAQHITVKVLTSTCFTILSYITLLLSLMIFCAGEKEKLFFQELSLFCKEVYAEIGFHFVAIAGVLFLLLLFTPVVNFSIYGACISVGQLFKKNRVLAAVGAFFIFTWALEIFATVLTMVTANIVGSSFVGQIEIFATEHPYTFTYLILFGIFAAEFLLAFIAFSISNHIMKKRLNLE